MKTKVLRIMVFAILFALIFGGLYGCQSFKDYLNSNKDTLKEVVKGLVGTIVDEIFKELIDNQKIKTTTDRSINRSQLYSVGNETPIYTQEQIATIKQKLKERITKEIDSKEINVNDYFTK